MTTADRLRSEGHAIGRAEGRIEGMAEMLLQQVGRRFGPLPPTVAARIHGAGLPDLHAWIDRLLDAGTLDDIFGSPT